MNNFRKLKIKYRLLLVFLLVSIVPILCLGTFSYAIYSKSIEEKISNTTMENVTLIHKNLMTEIEKYEFLVGSISFNKEIQNYLSSESEDFSKEYVYLAIEDIINGKVIYQDKVKNIRIQDKEAHVFFDIGYDNISNEKMKEMLGNVDERAPYDQWQYVKTFRSANTIILSRRIVDRYDLKTVLGYACVYIDETLFSENILDNENKLDGSESFLIKSDGTILSSNNKVAELGKLYPQKDLISQLTTNYKNKIFQFTTAIHEEKQLITYRFIESMDCFLVSKVPYAYIYSEMNSLSTKMYIFEAVVIFICLIMIAVLYESIMHPINKMVKSCKTISEGCFSARICDESKDEVSILGDNMDLMMEKIEMLLEQQIKEQEQKRNLELKMLQYQINPHFLFNTLNTLKWIAVINKVNALSDGIGALAELLKSTIVDVDALITVRDELANLKNYFEIQKLRYASGFEVSYILDEKFLDCMIPRFILQPIAENSILHGMQDEYLKITISCYGTDANNCLIEIKDDGKGFDCKEIPEIKARKMTGIGVQNVDERLKLTYGADYGVEMYSEVGKGTITQIKVPLEFKEK